MTVAKALREFKSGTITSFMRLPQEIQKKIFVRLMTRTWKEDRKGYVAFSRHQYGNFCAIGAAEHAAGEMRGAVVYDPQTGNYPTEAGHLYRYERLFNFSWGNDIATASNDAGNKHAAMREVRRVLGV